MFTLSLACIAEDLSQHDDVQKQKKEQLLVNEAKRLVHVLVRWLINSWSLTKPVKTIVNRVKLLQPNSSFSPALERV